MMKNNIIKALFFTFLVVAVFSCKKEENKVVLESATAPALTVTPLSNALNIASKNLPALTFSWTNPNYTFNTGPSSQNVTYTLQVDSAGANFSSNKLKEVGFTNDLSSNLTVGQFNNLFATFQENIPHNFEFRIKASLGANGNVPQYSNVIKMTVTPYLDVAVPLPFTGDLYIIGNATPGGDATGWNNPVPSPSQKFTKTTSTTYEITINLFGGKEFLILPDNGSWSNKYAVKASTATKDGGDFGYNLGDNFPGPSVTGLYKIVLNFKTGRYTVTKI